MAESIWSDGGFQSQTQNQNQNQTLARNQTASRWSAPSQGQRTRREDHALSHRPQMSSGRLFLDRVARQQSPSPLHRQPEHNTPFSGGQGQGDISTLPARGHFYFALTRSCRAIDTRGAVSVALNIQFSEGCMRHILLFAFLGVLR